MEKHPQDAKGAASKQGAAPSACPMDGIADMHSLLGDATINDPFPIYRAFRAERPVAYLKDQGFWLISRYDDCVFVLNHPELFSSREAVSSTNVYRNSPEALAILKTSKAQPRAHTLITADPPIHERSRTILQHALAPTRTVRELTPWLRTVIDELIDGFCERGACEFVAAGWAVDRPEAAPAAGG